MRCESLSLEVTTCRLRMLNIDIDTVMNTECLYQRIKDLHKKKAFKQIAVFP